MFEYLFPVMFEFKRGFALHYPLLFSIVYGLETKNAFEFGAGLSTRVILEALDVSGGKLISCSLKSKDEILGGRIKDHLRWTHFHMKSDALDMKQIEGSRFDFVLHDGSHRGDVLKRDLRKIVPLIKQYGILLIHDTHHSKVGERMRQGLLSGLEGVKHSKVTLPYGYGLTIVKVDGNESNGQVDITRGKIGGTTTTIPVGRV